jgi:hypothetical protein
MLQYRQLKQHGDKVYFCENSLRLMTETLIGIITQELLNISL